MTDHLGIMYLAWFAGAVAVVGIFVAIISSYDVHGRVSFCAVLICIVLVGLSAGAVYGMAGYPLPVITVEWPAAAEPAAP